jgi:uncharacterized membrane protein YraQ (UPF0718 family)
MSDARERIEKEKVEELECENFWFNNKTTDAALSYVAAVVFFLALPCIAILAALLLYTLFGDFLHPVKLLLDDLRAAIPMVVLMGVVLWVVTHTQVTPQTRSRTSAGSARQRAMGNRLAHAAYGRKTWRGNLWGR